MSVDLKAVHMALISVPLLFMSVISEESVLNAEFRASHFALE